MSKIKERFWNFVNSEDYYNYYLRNTSRTHQIDACEVYTEVKYPSINELRNALRKRFKKEQTNA